MSHIQSTSTWNTSTANAQAATNQLTVPKGSVSHEILVLSDSWPKPSSLLTDAMQSPLGTLFLIGTDVGNILRVSKKPWAIVYCSKSQISSQLVKHKDRWHKPPSIRARPWSHIPTAVVNQKTEKKNYLFRRAIFHRFVLAQLDASRTRH